MGGWLSFTPGSRLPPTRVFHKQTIPKVGEGPLHDALRKAQRQYVESLGKSTVLQTDLPPQNSGSAGGLVVQSRLFEKERGGKEGETEPQGCDNLSRSVSQASDTADVPVVLEKGESFSKGVRGKDTTSFFYSVGQDPSPTVIDVEKGVQRPGLGPQHVDLLGLQKEYIGLPTPNISLDYPSPFKGPAKYAGAVLSQVEIEKCRLACLARPRDRKSEIKPSRSGSPSKRKKMAREYRELYFVDFPADEEEEVQGVPLALMENEENSLGKRCRLQDNMEKQLVVGMERNLSLKRNREEGEAQELIIFEPQQGVKRRKGGEGGDKGDEDLADVSSDMDYSAEEASLPMPPQWP